MQLARPQKVSKVPHDESLTHLSGVVTWHHENAWKGGSNRGPTPLCRPRDGVAACFFLRRGLPSCPVSDRPNTGLPETPPAVTRVSKPRTRKHEELVGALGSTGPRLQVARDPVPPSLDSPGGRTNSPAFVIPHRYYSLCGLRLRAALGCWSAFCSWGVRTLAGSAA